MPPKSFDDIELEAQIGGQSFIRSPTLNGNLSDEDPLSTSRWACLNQSERRFGLLAAKGWLNNGKPPFPVRRFDAMRIAMLTMYMTKLHKREEQIGKRLELYTSEHSIPGKDTDALERMLAESDAVITDQWLDETVSELNSYTELLTGFNDVAAMDRSHEHNTKTYWDAIRPITRYATAFPWSSTKRLQDNNLADYLGGPLRDWTLPGGRPDITERMASGMVKGIKPLLPHQHLQGDANNYWDAGEGKMRRRQTVARFLLALVGSVFLLSPVVTLYFIKYNALRIGIMCAFVVAYSALLSILNLRPFESLSATAAMTAVLIVFVANV